MYRKMVKIRDSSEEETKFEMVGLYKSVKKLLGDNVKEVRLKHRNVGLTREIQNGTGLNVACYDQRHYAGSDSFLYAELKLNDATKTLFKLKAVVEKTTKLSASVAEGKEAEKIVSYLEKEGFSKA